MTTVNVKKEKTITSVLKKQATILNKEMLQASNELLDNSVKTAEKWQDLTEKVLKTGTKMFATQQEVALSTLEVVVGQFKATRKRFSKLIGSKPKTKKVTPSADESIESDLTIDELMEATVAIPKKATPSKKKTEVQVA